MSGEFWHSAPLPSGWKAEVLKRELLVIERVALDADWTGGVVTIDFKRRIFNGGRDQPHQHVGGMYCSGYGGSYWKKHIVEDAISWLEETMTKKQQND